MKEKFKLIFDPYTNSTRNYVQHIDYKNITIPKDVFDDMTEDELLNYVNQHLLDINKQISNKPIKKPDNLNLSDEEIAKYFSEIKNKINNMESFKHYFHRIVN
jgi:hypothetical protein